MWEYYAATEGAGTLVGPTSGCASRARSAGSTRPTTSASSTTTGTTAAPGRGRHRVPPRRPTTTASSTSRRRTRPTAPTATTHFTLGDVGYVDDDGYLFLTDRSAHLIISGGVNIYPAEVEAALLAHPAVGDVGVVGVPDDEWGEIVVAAVEPQAGVEPTDALAAELVEWCRDRIAHFKCPRHVIFVEALPRHDNGKLYKHQLRDAAPSVRESVNGHL